MADWRQIQARIRKAKAGDDAPARLAELYEKTRDAMVAFELARLHEKSGQNEEAVRWYTAAAERFRRAQWKAKAEEALARLGASAPAPAERASAPEPAPEEVSAPAGMEPVWESGESSIEQATLPLEPAAEKVGDKEPAPKRRRRRGRRGGRKRRSGQRAEARPARAEPVQAAPERFDARFGAIETPEAAPAPAFRPGPEPARVREPAGVPATRQARTRAGEPALASRLAHLESQLRRLIASPLCRVDEADQAPAGPGVFIVSDSEQTTCYYIEACQTLRVGVGNLLRGERGARRGESLRSRFAEHLGISESRVSKYLKEHCAVRWLQLDEGAPALAHFAIAVLRPALND